MTKALFTRSRAVLLAGAGALSLGGPALAQSAATPQEPQGSVEEVVVTAQKRAERLIDAPQSVSVVSTDNLDKLAATQLVDLANTVPALQIVTQGAGKSTVVLRGVTTGNDVAPTVGIYVDEVPYGSSTAFVKGALLALDVGLFDLDHIEVLRGPQGTLYGASSLGGVLKYVTPTPSLTSSSESLKTGVSDTFHGGTSYNLAGVINAPIVEDKVALRASAYYNKDGGYIDNIGNGEKDVDQGEIYGARADLLVRPTDDLSLRITGFAQNIRRDGGRYSDYAFDSRPVAGSLIQNHPLSEPFASDFRLISGTINYDFGWSTLTSVTSYQSAKNTFTQDLTAGYAPLLPLLGISADAVGYTEFDTTNKFAQEVRLASPTDRRVSWLVGGFYTRENSTSDYVSSLYGPGLVVLPINFGEAQSPSSYDEYAFFADLTLKLTDKLDVTGGVRYAHNHQATESTGGGLLGASVGRRESAEGVFTYLANARYRFSDHMTAYARYATGYRPGGPNPPAFDIITGKPLFDSMFHSDTLSSYELGINAETADRKYSVSASAYLIDWNDIQLVAFRQGRTGLVNGPTARIEGAELTVTARPVPELVFSGSIGLNHSYLTADDPDLGSRKGERLPESPKFSASLNADYTFHDAPWAPSIGATLRYITDRTVSFDGNIGTPQYTLPGYAQLDVRAGATVSSVDVRLFVRNILNERGQLSGLTYLSSYGAPAQVTVIQPRTIGISLSAQF